MVELLDYVKERIEEQIKWYEKKANSSKAKFHAYQILIIVTSALIPVINVIDFAPIGTRIISSILGSVIVGITGLIQLKKYQENWILFRTNEELLKKEKYLFISTAGEYANLNSEEQRKRLLVERTESIISSETSKFFAIHSTKPPTRETLTKEK